MSGVNSKFDYATLYVNWSLLSQNFVLKFYLDQKLSRKDLWGVGSTPPPRERSKLSAQKLPGKGYFPDPMDTPGYTSTHNSPRRAH